MAKDRLDQFIEDTDERFRELNARTEGIALVVLTLVQSMDRATVIAHLRSARVFAEKAHLHKAAVHVIDEMIRDLVPPSGSDRQS